MSIDSTAWADAFGVYMPKVIELTNGTGSWGLLALAPLLIVVGVFVVKKIVASLGGGE